jgi:hypothetical protein
MYLQALLIRAAVAVATGLMLTAAVFINHGGQAAHAATPAAVTTAKSARSAISEPVMLPTIHVRPTAADLAAASAPKQSPARLIIDVALPNLPAASAASSLRGSSIDMPYYSFGKVLPRIGSKE